MKGMNDEASECSSNEMDIQRCPFLRNINKPTCFSFSTMNFTFPVLTYLLSSLYHFMIAMAYLIYYFCFSRFVERKGQFLRMVLILILRLTCFMVKMGSSHYLRDLVSRANWQSQRPLLISTPWQRKLQPSVCQLLDQEDHLASVTSLRNGRSRSLSLPTRKILRHR